MHSDIHNSKKEARQDAKEATKEKGKEFAGKIVMERCYVGPTVSLLSQTHLSISNHPIFPPLSLLDSLAVLAFYKGYL